MANNINEKPIISEMGASDTFIVSAGSKVKRLTNANLLVQNASTNDATRAASAAALYSVNQSLAKYRRIIDTYNHRHR